MAATVADVKLTSDGFVLASYYGGISCWPMDVGIPGFELPHQVQNSHQSYPFPQWATCLGLLVEVCLRLVCTMPAQAEMRSVGGGMLFETNFISTDAKQYQTCQRIQS